MADEALIELLRTVTLLAAAPRAELEWLAAHGQRRQYAVGDIALRKSEEAQEMIVLFSGRIVVYFGQATGRGHQMDSHAGTITGVLPFSRLKRPFGDVVVEEASDVLAVDRRHFPEMIRECPMVTEQLVHSMLDRARRFSAINWQDEKMVSLGRLAAGLAHEINNPASAALRGAAALRELLPEAGRAAAGVGEAGLTGTQQSRIAAAIAEGVAWCGDVVGSLSPIAHEQRESALAAWLAPRGLDVELAEPLATGGVSPALLSDVAEAVGGAPLPAVLEWMAAAITTQVQAVEVERAVRRIHDLVSSISRFTTMDRSSAPVPTDIGTGLRDTVAVLAAKARAKETHVALTIAPDLPLVPAKGGELNQVWSNLIENALDAIAPSGEVHAEACVDGGNVVVRIIDNGPGIPADVEPRIFDPFFTTKPVGEGMGLGLDIVRRVLRDHAGQVEFESRPGRTEFRVRIPIAGAEGPSQARRADGPAHAVPDR
jgi:signal transduction histidine kinase